VTREAAMAAFAKGRRAGCSKIGSSLSGANQKTFASLRLHGILLPSQFFSDVQDSGLRNLDCAGAPFAGIDDARKAFELTYDH